MWEVEIWGQETLINTKNEIYLPIEFDLEQNYPNPFNPITTISYYLPNASKVSLKVYDILGNEVSILVDEFQGPGKYNIDFKAKNLTSGVYFYCLQAGEFSDTRKMILIK